MNIQNYSPDKKEDTSNQDIVNLLRKVHQRLPLDNNDFKILRTFSKNPPTHRLYKLLLEGLDDYVLMEVLSYIYYDTGMLDFDQKIDSRVFYDSGRNTEFLTLQYFYQSQQYERETILVDETIDEDLRTFVEEVRTAMHKCLDNETTRELTTIYKMIAMMVHARITDSTNTKPPEKIGNVVKIGSIRTKGVCRHASILFKYLCDKLSRDVELVKRKMLLLCRLCRGKHNQDHAWNVVVDEQGDLHLLDVSRNPQELIQNKKITEQYKRGNFEVLGTFGAESVHKWFTKIDKEEVFEEIGNGRYGVVHRVKITMNEGTQEAARKTVKLMPQRFEADIELATREIKLAKYYFHRNLLPYKYHKFEVNADQSSMKLYTELMHTNASQFIQKSELKDLAYLREATILLLCVARGIRYLHNKDHMHRDIKPSNCMINIDPITGEITECKLGDFGTSKKVDIFISGHSLNVGTKAYQDPSVKLSGHYSFEVDIYSLGVMIREVVCRRDPTSVTYIDMKNDYNTHPAAVKLAALQLMCCSKSARPHIETVVMHLEQILIDNFLDSTVNPPPILKVNRKRFEYVFDENIVCLRSLDKEHIAIIFRNKPYIHIWCVEDGFHRVRTINQDKIKQIWDVVVCGDLIACSAAPLTEHDNAVIISNWKKGTILNVIPMEAQISAGKSPIHFITSSNIAICLKNGNVILYDCKALNKTVIKVHDSEVMCIVSIARQKDGKVILATGSIDKTIKFWNATTFENIKTVHCEGKVISLCKTQNMILCGTSRGEIKVWDTNEIKLVCEYKLEKTFITQIEAIGDNAVLSVVNSGATVATTKVFNITNCVIDRVIERREPRQASKKSKFNTVITLHNDAVIIGGKDGIIRYFE
jgi:serine/threonine protein kinase